MNERLCERIIAGACLLYAIVWLVASFMPSALLGEIIAPPPVGVKFIPGSLVGAVLFGAAPIMRKQERSMGILFAAATIALVSPGLWMAAQGEVGLGEGLLWIATPLAIAAWVATGSYDRLERPESAGDAVGRIERDRDNSSFAVQFFLGVVFAAIVAIVALTVWRTFP
jgi:hypothetical protein